MPKVLTVKSIAPFEWHGKPVPVGSCVEVPVLDALVFKHRKVAVFAKAGDTVLPREPAMVLPPVFVAPFVTDTVPEPLPSGEVALSADQQAAFKPKLGLDITAKAQRGRPRKVSGDASTDDSES